MAARYLDVCDTENWPTESGHDCTRMWDVDIVLACFGWSNGTAPSVLIEERLVPLSMFMSKKAISGNVQACLPGRP